MADRNVQIVSKAGSKPQQGYFSKTASTAYDANSLVKFTSGKLAPSADNDTQVVAIIKKEIASTDATTDEQIVDILQSGDIVEMDTTAALTVGVSYGISNAYTVDQSDTTNKVFTCLKVISSTRAQGYLKSLAADAVT